MEFFDAIEKRHSYRGAFRPDPVPREDLIRILDAGLRAPSGCNEQTTSFVVVTDPALRGPIAALFDKPSVTTAPVLIVVTTAEVMMPFGLAFEVEDYGAAVENILLAATASGYASLWLDGYTRRAGVGDKIADLLEIPAGRTVRAVLPLGIPEAPGAQAGRKPMEERVAWRE